MDLSCILRYVSPRELERFENEQFALEAEAEAEAVAARAEAEAEKLALRRLEKNARLPGAGRGSRMLSRLGLDTEVRRRGRPRGRGRGRGRASLARGSWAGDDDAQAHLINTDPLDALHRENEEQGQLMMVAETESDEDAFEDAQQISPGIARSAFVANSALPVSPVTMHRRPSAAFPAHRAPSDSGNIEDSDLDLIAADDRSMSSASMQVRAEDDWFGQLVEMAGDQSGIRDRHRTKRRRTDSTASVHRMAPSKTYTSVHHLNLLPSQAATSSSLSPTSSDGESDGDSKSNTVPIHSIPISNGHSRNMNHGGLGLDDLHIKGRTESVEDGGEHSDDEDAEEYVVESITEHYYEAGQLYYLVKWAGYEESYDWLAGNDLTGASEVIAEYKQRISMQKGKTKVR